MNPAVLVLVGTDHHPFHRLVAWADEWADRHSAADILVQYGYSPAPVAAPGVAFLTPADLGAKVRDARAVVTHGGPGTAMDVRASGRRPILVPRNPDLGEHVDDHQQRFARWIAQKDMVDVVTDTVDLAPVVERELLAPTPVDASGAGNGAAAQRLTHLLSTHSIERITNRRKPSNRIRIRRGAP